MTQRQLLVALALVGLAAGVIALATRSDVAAVAAGAASVGVASFAVRLVRGVPAPDRADAERLVTERLVAERPVPVPNADSSPTEPGSTEPAATASSSTEPSSTEPASPGPAAPPVAPATERAPGDGPDPSARVDAGMDAGTDAGPAPEVDGAGRRRGEDAVAELGPFGLFGPVLLDTTLRNRVAVARRALRPLSVVHFEVFDVDGDHAMAVPTRLVAAAIEETLRESDVAGWRSDGVFVFLLEDTGEDGAVWTAERLRRRFTAEQPRRRFRAGIAAYPTHGLDADAVDGKAAEALRVARDWNRDRIEVATGS